MWVSRARVKVVGSGSDFDEVSTLSSDLFGDAGGVSDIGSGVTNNLLAERRL